jgi:hypothetical protein
MRYGNGCIPDAPAMWALLIAGLTSDVPPNIQKGI